MSQSETNNPYYGLKFHIAKTKNLNQNLVADMINMPRTTFNLKLNRRGGRDFTLEEAKEIAKRLAISIDDFFLQN